MAQTKTYSPKRVKVIFGDAQLSGYADGSFVTIEMASDTFTKNVGADGEVARSASADESGSVKLMLQQTAASNAILSAAHNADRLSLLGTKRLQIEDTNGSTLFVAPEAWVMKPAVVDFGKEVNAREWTLEFGKATTFNQGGNL